MLLVTYFDSSSFWIFTAFPNALLLFQTLHCFSKLFTASPFTMNALTSSFRALRVTAGKIGPAASTVDKPLRKRGDLAIEKHIARVSLTPSPYLKNTLPYPSDHSCRTLRTSSTTSCVRTLCCEDKTPIASCCLCPALLKDSGVSWHGGYDQTKSISSMSFLASLLFTFTFHLFLLDRMLIFAIDPKCWFRR